MNFLLTESLSGENRYIYAADFQGGRHQYYLQKTEDPVLILIKFDDTAEFSYNLELRWASPLVT